MQARILRFYLLRFAALPALLVMALLAGSAGAGPACKQPKQWFAGQCRYPYEIQQIKARQAQQYRQRDKAACDKAREQASIDGWKEYLKDFSHGSCQKEAEEQIAALEEKAKPSPPPTATTTPTAPPTATTTSKPSPPPPPKPEGSGISPLTWVGFGVGAAGLIVWGITGGISMSKSSSLKDECPSNLCPPEQESELDSATTLAHVATAGLVVGAVGCTVGLVALLALGSDEAEPSDDSSKAAVVLRPLLGPTSIGLAGSF